MTSDTSGPQDPVQAGEAVADTAADTMRAAATDVAANAEHATAAMADGAQSAADGSVQAASSASRASVEAFGQARERLNAMADSLPAPAQEMFRPFRAGSEAFGKGLGSSYTTAMEGMAEFNTKAIGAWRSNAESAIRHWQSLVGVKSLSEAIALNAEHTRQQLETVTAQTRELSALATRIMRDAADPLKIGNR